MKIHNVQQNTLAWEELRCGIITASAMTNVMAGSAKNANERKTRATYMREKAGEIITGRPHSGYYNKDMERGHILEAEAFEIYGDTMGVTPVAVGFVTNHDNLGTVGASPDGFVLDIGGVEIKNHAPHVMIDKMVNEKISIDYYRQTQTNIWVCEREYWDYMGYCPGMQPYIRRVYRDDGMIEVMQKEVISFYQELKELIYTIRNTAVFAEYEGAA